MKNNNYDIDWYQKMPKKLVPKYWNPNAKKIGLSHPLRCLLIAPSGGRKTTRLLSILTAMACFKRIIIVLPCAPNEPLYEFLKELVPPEQLEFHTLATLPSVDDLEGKEQTAIVFDDLVMTKDTTQKISNYFISGRKKMEGRGLSCFYLSQSYFSIPILIRRQAQVIIIGKLNSIRDFKRILAEHSFGKTLEQLIAMYNYCIDRGSFLLIDMAAPEHQRFREGFTHVL